MRRAISVTNGPTFLAPFARSAAPPQPSSRRPPTPKSCPCISKKSGTTSHRARTQPLFSTALDIISPPASPYPATSHLFTSRPTHPSSTRSKRLAISARQQALQHDLRKLRRYPRKSLPSMDVLRQRQGAGRFNHHTPMGKGQSLAPLVLLGVHSRCGLHTRAVTNS